MKSKTLIILIAILLVAAIGVFAFRSKISNNSPLIQNTRDLSTDEAKDNKMQMFDDNDQSDKSQEMLEVGPMIEDVGLMISMTGYQMEGPIHMSIRQEVNDLNVGPEGQGYYVRTDTNDMSYEQALENVEKRLNQMGFSKKVYDPDPKVNNILAYRQYKTENITCVFEKKQIGSTGKVDITIGCFE